MHLILLCFLSFCLFVFLSFCLFVFLFYAELRGLDSHGSIATPAAHDEVGIKLQNIKLLEGTK